MSKRENILVIAAHSDDHIIGAGGTIAKYAAEGKKVRVVVLSYGEKTHPWLKARYSKEMRAQEAKSADKLVGCKSTFFDLKEGKFEEGYPKIKQKIVSILKKQKPVKIFTHSNEDIHPDHRAAYAITEDALKELKETGIKPEMYLFSIWNPISPRRNNTPKMYVDISKTHIKKMAALSHFRSQWAALALLIGSIIAKEVKNGLHIGSLCAERFYKHK